MIRYTALLLTLLAPFAFAETVDKDILYPVAAVELQVDGSRGLLPVGKDHGVVEGGLRNLYRREGEGSFTYRGRVELLSVADSSCVVRMAWAVGDTLRAHDAVDLRFRLLAPAERQVAWELIDYGLVLAGSGTPPFYDFRAVMGDSSSQQDSLTFARATTAVSEALPSISEFEIAHVPIEMGRYSGQTVYETMAVTTPAMVEDFFQYLHSFAASYMGIAHDFPAIYATWLLHGASRSPEEVLADGLDSLLTRLPDILQDIEDPEGSDTWPLHWYSRIRDRWTAERHPERMEMLVAFRVVNEVVDVQRWWDLYWNARADILDWNGEQEAAIEAYEQALVSAAGDSGSLAITHNNMAGVYKDLGRCAEAIHHYETALRLRSAWRNPDANSRAAITWAHLARCRRDLGDYEGTVAAFEISARLYGEQGHLHALEQRYHDLSALGDLHNEHGRNREAIAAWRRGLETARELGWRATVADALDDMSDGHWNLGEYARAVELREEAVQLHGEEGYPRDQAITQTNLAILHSILGASEKAADYYRLAIESHRSREEWYDLGDVYLRLGSMEREQRLFDEAWEHLALAEQWLAEHGEAGDLAGVQLERAEVCEGRGNGHAADSLYTLALAGFQSVENVQEEARTCQWWGSSLIRRKEQERALAMLSTSLELFEAVDDLGGLADTYLTLGNLHGNILGNPAEARAYGDRALSYARAMPDPNREANALLMQVDQLFTLGEMDSAFSMQHRAIALFRSSGNERGTLNSIAGLGSLHAQRGEFDRATALFDSTMIAAESHGFESELCFILDRRGWFSYKNGRYASARTDSDRCLALSRALGDELLETRALNTLASIEHALGDYDAALARYEHFRIIVESWRDSFGLSAYHNNSGEVWYALGDYERAGKHFRLALQHGERIGYITAITAAAGNLARVHMELGQSEEALALAARSLVAAERSGQEPRILNALHSRGEMLKELGWHEEAREILTPLLPRARQSGSPVLVAMILSELGTLARSAGDRGACRDALNEACAMARELGNPSLLWAPLTELARSQRDAGEGEAALASFREALASLESVRSGLSDEKQGASFQARHEEVYRELVDLLLSLGHEEEAWSVIGLMKSDELRELGERTRRAGLDESDAALMQEAEHLLSREANLARQLAEEQTRSAAELRSDFIDELKAEIKAIQKRFRSFIRDLADEHPKLVERLEIQPSNLQVLQKKLGEGEAFMEPLLLPDRLVLFLVRAGKAPLIYRELAVSEARVDSLIIAMRESLARPGAAWDTERSARLAGRPTALQQQDPSIPARNLHDLLLAPLAGDLQGVEHLIVSPSGRLRYIPFAALYDGERYLVERYTLSALTQAGAMGGHNPVSTGSPLLAFGNPDGSLPGAEREVQNLAALWEPAPVTTVYGASATLDRLEDELEDSRILHLATHGMLRSDRPEDSYILLAGDSEGDNLKLMDIVTLPLADIELAVLSACQTALGDDGTGREITSLAHTFEQTGAAAVIASLWSVSDASTSSLMVNFYSELREAGATRASALRTAQLAMLANEQFAHPYYWAPFILIGNWH